MFSLPPNPEPAAAQVRSFSLCVKPNSLILSKYHAKGGKNKSAIFGLEVG